VSGNQALGATGKARGGGAYVLGNLFVNRSSIRDNNAFSTGNSAFGGGVYVIGTAQVYAATISGNSSEFAGGIRTLSSAAFNNSTVSGNSATVAGGIVVNGSVVLDNSTVAFNTHSSLEFGAGTLALGVVARSSIIAKNTSIANGQNVDLLCSNCFPSGSRNLITGSNSEAGSNIHGFPFDQRGHARVFGSAPDVGAFESGAVSIFADGFE
jgi:NDP-sugar pyrophosphorylase family protein